MKEELSRARKREFEGVVEESEEDVSRWSGEAQ